MEENTWVLPPQMAQKLLAWYARGHRDLPWRQDREPYHVWLSEVMLQQTRVAAVRGYYARFLQALPTIASLAAAEEGLLLKLWEGLGYYSRVRNLQKAAREIMERYGGCFPRDYAAIRALAGIGDYTAGAICSICFDQPVPAVDGNVLRVAARLAACDAPVTAQRTKRQVTAALAALYPQEGSSELTQALMELGATVCIPNGAPLCEACPLCDDCRARKLGVQRELPVRAEKAARKTEARSVFILRCKGNLALRKRPPRGLLAGMWQLPDVKGTLRAQEAIEQAERWGLRVVQLQKTSERKHIFTHITWEMTGFYIDCATMPEEFEWASRAALEAQYALPTAYRQFLD